MATQDSTNTTPAQQTWSAELFAQIREREERAYALVLAIQAQLPHDLHPDRKDFVTTTGHLLNVLDDLLSDHTLLNACEDVINGEHGRLGAPA